MAKTKTAKYSLLDEEIKKFLEKNPDETHSKICVAAGVGDSSLWGYRWKKSEPKVSTANKITAYLKLKHEQVWSDRV